MLDVGWTELVVIAIVMIIVVGPKDLPPMLRTFGKMMTKMRGMASDFRQQFDEALKEADLDDVRKTLSEAQKLNPAHSLREAMNPLRQMGNEIKADLQKATTVETKPAEPVVPEVSAEAVVPQEQPKADPVAAAAIASAAKQLDRAAAATPVAEPKVKRVSKPKAIVAEAAVSTPVKAAAKKAKTAPGDTGKQPGRKAAAKTTKKKGDA
ncbi:Sec-independent protein translocase protein TatB [Pararhizobium sp. BT-229]|uniref:Sec-independent protein translocase protein TatB n=1 Tax=Pararhizobium sp. BT-229 TaxID=2986923 RepID=UPI0021F7F990|nr:Sec-independent protein translocase protein TatB [Pararhizobium sp. BT-229]MCV9965270.1 Sec-independent protein translocase protein TatB [Pararhizobium sp. BT-229]